MQLNSRYTFIYSEYSYLLFVGFFGLCKMKFLNFIQLLYVRSNILFGGVHWITRSFFFNGHDSASRSLYSKPLLGLVKSLFSQVTFRLFSFMKNLFKLNGIGFRIFFSNNFYFFKLGYSHLILNYLELFSFFIKKKMKFLIVHSLFSPIFSLYKVLHYRKMNVYTGKGVLSSGQFKNFTKKVYKK